MQYKTLDEIAFINPDSIKKEYPHSEIEYIDISSVGTGQLIETKPMLLSEASSRAKRLVKDEDTILSTVRPNRRSFLFIKKPRENIVVSTGFAVLRAKNGTDPRYLYYVITDQKFTDYLTLSAKGAAYPAVDTEIVQRGKVPYWSSDVQKKISTVLSTYDDLLENNIRRIQVLEEMCQRLYREWFVDFRFPGHERSEFINSELGKIPCSWCVTSISEICDYISRGVTPKYELNTKRFVINQKVNRGMFLAVNELKELTVDLDVPKTKYARYGDVLINCLGEGTIGRVHLYTERHQDWAVDQHMSICRSTMLSKAFYLYFVLVSPEGQSKIESLKTGGTNMTMFNISSLRNYKIILPQEDILNNFFLMVEPIFKQKQVLIEKNRNLTITRDTLLPKLISGEINVAEMDIAIQEQGDDA
jgi:type I restriction enzyme S subunit